jgi:hypothetical protein
VRFHYGTDKHLGYVLFLPSRPGYIKVLILILFLTALEDPS